MAKKKTEENPSVALVKQIQDADVVQTALVRGRDWSQTTALASTEEARLAKKDLDLCKDAHDLIEEKRKFFVDGLNRSVKFFNSAAKPWRDEVDGYATHLKALLRDHEASVRTEALKLAEKEAKKYDKKGATQVADEIRREALEQQVFEGTRSQRKARVTNLSAFLHAALEQPALLDMVEVKMPMLNALAKATKGASEIPGVEFYSETVFSRGRGE